MDVVVVILVLGALAVMIFKKFKSFVYYIVLADILLRLLSFLSINLNIKVITDFLNTYFPNSLINIIGDYSSGIFTTVLKWGIFILYVVFEYYLIKLFMKKK